MPAITEDERDALEDKRLEEELRLREEAARVLAEQAALAAQQQQSLPPIPQGGNYMNQSQGEINALQTHFNEIAQGRGLPATRTTDSQEYMDEVARAQRNSGFINATVGPGGNVITPGYDPSTDLRALKAQQEATNLQRNQYVDSLIKGGATYAEAYRAGQGRYPQAKNDAMRLKIEQLASQQNFQPRRVTSNGVAYDELKRGIYSRAPAPAPTKANPGSIPKDVIDERERLQLIATEKRAELRKGTKRMWSEKDGKTIEVELNAAQKKTLQDEIDTFTRNARELTHPGGNIRPEYNPRVDQKTFNRDLWYNLPPMPSAAPVAAPQASPAPIPVAPTAATPAQAKAVNEIRRMTKGGKVAVYDKETEQFIRYE